MTAPSYLYSRTVRKPIRFEWWQAGETTPIDCTGLIPVVAETALPWTPAIVAINAALGQFEVAAPSAVQAALLVEGRRYGLRIELRSAGGAAIEEFSLILVAT